MIDYIELGTTPVDENCAQLGEEDYYEKAREECKRFISLLRKKFGNEPKGARLRIKRFPYDYGVGNIRHYYEVVVEFDDRYEKAVDYAFNIEANLPLTWEDKK